MTVAVGLSRVSDYRDGGRPASRSAWHPARRAKRRYLHGASGFATAIRAQDADLSGNQDGRHYNRQQVLTVQKPIVILPLRD